MFLKQKDKFIPLKAFFSIGSDLQNHIVIKSDHIAPQHARIRKYSNGYQIQRINSQHKVFLNKQEISSEFLKDGDEITLAETSFHFTDMKRPPLTSKNPLWQKELLKLYDISLSNLPVLMTGPSGSGKDRLARFMHDVSSRSHKPMVILNCGAFHSNLAASELFGHIKGSFTDALRDREGAFETAHGSTLFLDEIGDLPLSIQPQLLRVLENQQIKPLGSDKTICVDVRIITATHHDLKKKVLTGEFREDLYYRLSVLKVKIPPLKERIEDFETLIFQFAREMKVRFSYLAIEFLKKQNWNGNVRELKNLVARASVLYKGQTICKKEAFILLDPIYKDTQIKDYNDLKHAEKEMIVYSLTQHKGNRAKAAYDLKIPRTTLYEKTKQYKIDIQKLKL